MRSGILGNRAQQHKSRHAHTTTCFCTFQCSKRPVNDGTRAPHRRRSAGPSYQASQEKRSTLSCQANQQPNPPGTEVNDSSDGMEAVLQQHAARILSKATKLKPPAKYLVAIAGAPGSGKTSTSHAACRILNSMASSTASSPVAAVASMDGFHFYRSELDAMEDPEEAHARRGAHWTFNSDAFVAAVQELRTHGEVELPSFDHAAGDPVEKDVSIKQHHRIVLIEGNYVLLDEQPWCTIQELVDESWFISCPLDTAMERVIQRQVNNGSDLENARWRVANNDRPNAELIQHSANRATHVIPSQPFKDSSYLQQ